MFCTVQFLGTVTTLHVYVFIDVANLRGIRLGIEPVTLSVLDMIIV